MSKLPKNSVQQFKHLDTDQSLWRQIGRENWPFGLLLIIHLAGLLTFMAFAGEAGTIERVIPVAAGAVYALDPFRIGLCYLAAWAGYLLINGMLIVRPDRPISWFLGRLWDEFGDLKRWVNAILGLAFLSGTIALFLVSKHLIPFIAPFSWDPLFMVMDRVLHGGIDPWRLLWPVFGSVPATTFLNFLYHFWFLLLFGVACYAAFDRQSPRNRFVILTAIALTWFLGGNIAALAFSSAGPVYYQAFGFGPYYAEQFEHLAVLHSQGFLHDIDAQGLLLDAFQSDPPLSSISAFPSIHVMMSVTLTFAGFLIHRRFGVVMCVFSLLILIGSVHIGWHYAVDGYFGAIFAAGCWWLVNRMADMLFGKPLKDPAPN
jgi:hypothetical protein